MNSFPTFCFQFPKTIHNLIKYPLLTIMLCCTVTLHLNAQSGNPKISIQGTLKSASGASVADDEYEVTFHLYNVPTGGMPLWSEDTMVTVIGGIYSHYLGSVNPLNPADFGSTLYLGVEVKGYELTPRSELAYAPYSFSVSYAQSALNADNATTATTATTAEKVLCSGAVGDIKFSILNPTDFAQENGNCWIPLDGRTIAGTELAKYITSIPNAGGLFIRAQEFNVAGAPNHDPNRTFSSPIATLQSDTIESHNHAHTLTTASAGDHSHSVTIDIKGEDNGGNVSDDYNYSSDDNTGKSATETTNSTGAHTHTINGSISNYGGAETRPKNLNFWIYIRVN